MHVTGACGASGAEPCVLKGRVHYANSYYSSPLAAGDRHGVIFMTVDGADDR